MSFLADTLSAAAERLPPNLRSTWEIRSFGLTKVPLILYCMPTVIRLDDAVCAVRIPLNWRTRNHYRSMYFGCLAVGADVAGGFLAMHHTRKSPRPVGLLFKDFKADFLKRPEADVVFRSEDGPAMAALVQEALDTGKRVNGVTHVTATTPSLLGDEPVAKFALTVSLKAGT